MFGTVLLSYDMIRFLLFGNPSQAWLKIDYDSRPLITGSRGVMDGYLPGTNLLGLPTILFLHGPQSQTPWMMPLSDQR